MLSSLFGNSFSDSSFVKVSKENWSKIEWLLQSKNEKIAEQQKLINAQHAELSILRRYKENDDLLFSYEKALIAEQNKTKNLEREIQELSKGVKNAHKKLDSVMALESVYLQSINHYKNNPKIITAVVYSDYNEKGDELVKQYA